MGDNGEPPTDQLKLILEETRTALSTMLAISEQMDLKLKEMGEDGNPNTKYHTDVLNMWSKLNKTISATQKIIENRYSPTKKYKETIVS